MTVRFTVIIPARLASTRLPGKMLLDISGKPLIQHVYEAASRSNAGKVIIATDDQQISDCAASFSAECMMTSADHTSGTDRLAEVISKLKIPDDEIVVNVQGDEMNMPPELINQVAGLLADNPGSQMATLCERITDQDEINDPNIVKVVSGENKTAIYFSRLPIPWHKTGVAGNYFRHIGIYAYRAGFLTEFSRMAKCTIEQAESLEQLRALYHGAAILVEEACAKPGIGIDTEADLQRARKLLN